MGAALFVVAVATRPPTEGLGHRPHCVPGPLKLIDFPFCASIENTYNKGSNMETTTSESVSSGLGPIRHFLLKTVIVCGAIIACGWIMLNLLDDFATRRIEQLERTVIGGNRFWTKLERELDRLADPRTDLTPEKKQKILSQIKVISDRWRPFLVEAASTIEGDSKK